MIVVTRIPTHRNDGTEISEKEISRILDRVRKKLGGFSFDPPSYGAWVAADGQVYEEESRKIGGGDPARKSCARSCPVHEDWQIARTAGHLLGCARRRRDYRPGVGALGQ